MGAPIGFLACWLPPNMVINKSIKNILSVISFCLGFSGHLITGGESSVLLLLIGMPHVEVQIAQHSITGVEQPPEYVDQRMAEVLHFKHILLG